MCRAQATPGHSVCILTANTGSRSIRIRADGEGASGLCDHNALILPVVDDSAQDAVRGLHLWQLVDVRACEPVTDIAVAWSIVQPEVRWVARAKASFCAKRDNVKVFPKDIR